MATNQGHCPGLVFKPLAIKGLILLSGILTRPQLSPSSSLLLLSLLLSFKGLFSDNILLGIGNNGGDGRGKNCDDGRSGDGGCGDGCGGGCSGGCGCGVGDIGVSSILSINDGDQI